MANEEQSKTARPARAPRERGPGGAPAVILLFACLAAIAGATAYLSIRLDALDEHINSARIAAEEAERAAGEAAQNSANPRQAARPSQGGDASGPPPPPGDAPAAPAP